jgi:hypothetical protein
MTTNPVCSLCDYAHACSRKLTFKLASGEEKTVLAKEQAYQKMRCQNIVDDICKDCALFHEQRCASWKVLNGKQKKKGTLNRCPAKVPQKK